MYSNFKAPQWQEFVNRPSNRGKDVVRLKEAFLQEQAHFMYRFMPVLYSMVGNGNGSNISEDFTLGDIAGIKHWWSSVNSELSISLGSKAYYMSDLKGDAHMSTLSGAETSGIVVTYEDSNFGGVRTVAGSPGNDMATTITTMTPPFTIIAIIRTGYSTDFFTAFHVPDPFNNDNFFFYGRPSGFLGQLRNRSVISNIADPATGIHFNETTQALHTADDLSLGQLDVPQVAEFSITETGAYYLRNGILRDGDAIDTSSMVLGPDFILGSSLPWRFGDIMLFDRELNNVDRNNILAYANREYNQNLPYL